MSRVQLALNVSNLDEAVEFYRRLFATEPAKRYPGYANFAVDDPPLKLVLFESPDAAGSINHLGVEVFDVDEVTQAGERLVGLGVDVQARESTTCCHAVQDKIWVSSPDDVAWEVYTVLADASLVDSDPSSCCANAEGTTTLACC